MYQLIKHNNIRTVKDAWNALYARNTQLTPYQEYSYCAIIDKYSRILKWRSLQTIIYELRDRDGRTIMVLPLHIKRTRNGNIAYFLGEKTSAGHLDFIYDERITRDAFLSAIKLINKDIGNVKFVLTRIAEQSKLNALIQSAFAPSRYLINRSICVHIPIPTSFHEYLNSLDKQVRQNLRTSFNRLKADNRAYEVRTYVNQPVPPAILRQLFKVYWERLSGKNISIGIKKSVLPVFLRLHLYPTVIALTKLPNVYYSIVYIDRAIAGFCAGFTSRNGRIILPFLSINSAFSRYSPGGILITEAIRFLIENRGYKYFDLSRGDEKYKYSYGGIEHLNFSYAIDPERTDQ